MNAAHPRIGLIHATPLAVEPVAQALARHWPQAQAMNLLDDSLSADRARDGALTPAMHARFAHLADYCLGTGCEALLYTCSAFGPAIDAVARAHSQPVLKPNEAMFVQALDAAARGARLGLVASFAPSLAPMADELAAMAAARAIPVPLATGLADGAMDDLARGDAATHDAKIAEAARALVRARGVTVLMLAQFSMARAATQAQDAAGVPVLTSPDCAVLALRARLVTG